MASESYYENGVRSPLTGSNMFPISALNNIVNSSSAHACNSRYLGLRKNPSLNNLANLKNLYSRKDVGSAFLLGFVFTIDLFRTQKKMLRIHARRVIAAMADVVMVGQLWSLGVGQTPRVARRNQVLPIDQETAVTARANGPGPKPAWSQVGAHGRPVLVHVRPKAFNRVFLAVIKRLQELAVSHHSDVPTAKTSLVTDLFAAKKATGDSPVPFFLPRAVVTGAKSFSRGRSFAELVTTCTLGHIGSSSESVAPGVVSATPWHFYAPKSTANSYAVTQKVAA